MLPLPPQWPAFANAMLMDASIALPEHRRNELEAEAARLLSALRVSRHGQLPNPSPRTASSAAAPRTTEADLPPWAQELTSYGMQPTMAAGQAWDSLAEALSALVLGSTGGNDVSLAAPPADGSFDRSISVGYAPLPVACRHKTVLLDFWLPLELALPASASVQTQ